VIAIAFAEAGAAGGEEFEGTEPLGGFPGVELGEDKAGGGSVFEGKGFAVMSEGDESFLREEVSEEEVGGPGAIEAVGEDVGAIEFDAGGEIDEVAGGDAFPEVREAEPANDAVEPGVDFDAGEGGELAGGDAVRGWGVGGDDDFVLHGYFL